MTQSQKHKPPNSKYCGRRKQMPQWQNGNTRLLYLVIRACPVSFLLHLLPQPR